MAGGSIRSSLRLASTILVFLTNFSPRPRWTSVSPKWAARNTKKKRKKKKKTTDGRRVAGLSRRALALVHQFRDEDQSHPFGLGLRQNFAKGLQRCGMRMPDGDGFALFVRAAQGALQLLADGSDFRDIIQERHVAEAGGYAQALSLVVRYRGSGGAAVDVKEFVLAQHGHQLV